MLFDIHHGHEWHMYYGMYLKKKKKINWYFALSK